MESIFYVCIVKKHLTIVISVMVMIVVINIALCSTAANVLEKGTCGPYLRLCLQHAFPW